MILSLFLLLFLFQSEAPFVVVLKNNQRIELQEPPNYEKNLVFLHHVNGQKMSLPANMVDKAKTESYNKALKEHREKLQREAERMKAQAAAEQGEPEPPPVIVINTKEVPEYNRAQNSASGFAEPAEAEEQGESRTFDFTSTDPVYIAREKQTVFSNRVVIEAILKVNHPGQVSNVMVTLNYRLLDSGENQMSQPATPATAIRGEELSVRFEIPTEDKVVLTQFTIQADLSDS
jgi:hypothetical protein